MAQVYRGDGPGVWHHVMNRGIASRTVFENRQDVRFFLSRLARAVRSGWIEVHAYSILTTHFHLLVRSPQGELARAMQRVQNAYVRWFNRSRRRDGPLFRGRYRSKPVESDEYWEALIHYIDQNPVKARIVTASPVYPYGSAYHYVRSQGPKWLSRKDVERTVMRARGSDRYDPGEYSHLFGTPLREGEAAAIERRILSRCRDTAFEDLTSSSVAAVHSWFVRKACMADGTRPGRTWVSTARIQQVVSDEKKRNPNWLVRSGRVRRSGWPLLQAGLLRYVCGLRLQEVASRQGCSQSASQHRVRVHDGLMTEDPDYAEFASRVLARVLEGVSRDRGE